MGEVGRITVRSGFQFSGYTSGDTKAFLDDYMVSGDVGRVDGEGRLYVVGRDGNTAPGLPVRRVLDLLR